MRNTILVALAAFGLGACGGERHRDTAVAITPVAAVDLTRYAGTWYEIARYPNWFERGCQGTTAAYALRDDGRVGVTNTCRKDALDGPVSSAEGVARAVDDTGAVLKVKFVQWLPFEGDYWIIYLDDDYRTAVIGTPAGSTGWILAREPQIGAERREAALAALRANGYDTDGLLFVPQPPSDS